MIKFRDFWLFVAAALAALVAPYHSMAQDEEQEEQDVTELLQEAGIELQQENFAKAAEIFGKVVKLDKDNGRAWHLYGYSLHAAGDLDEAIKAHKKATEFEQFKGISLYNLGCAYSLKKDADTAFEYLNKAVEAGFAEDRLENYETDPDFDNIRDDERFVALIKRLKGEDEPKTLEEFDASKLVGTWVYASGKRAGEEVGAERLAGEVTITKEEFTIPAGGGESFVMSYKIDAKKKPVAIDLKIESGPVPEGSAVGIIKMADGKITLCYDPTGQNRPEKFESTADNGCFLFTLKPKKSDDSK